MAFMKFDLDPQFRATATRQTIMLRMDVAPFQRVDRISNLPDNVMDNILTRLTLRDAAKTSILAKQWRYKWRNLTQLNFRKLWPKSEGNEELARSKFVQILYRILLCHQGPITKFTLNVPKFEGRSEIDPLIHILWKNNVEDLTLKTMDKYTYTLPSTIFQCLQLKYVSLSCCEINPPPSFKGFTGLIRLELEDVTIGAGRLADLISSCPLLEQLVLNIFDQPDRLEIHAPMLKLFDLTCDKASICFKESPFLAVVSVVTNEHANLDDQILNFEFLNSIPALQELHMDGFMLRYLYEAEFQTKIAPSLKKLNSLKLSEIEIDCGDVLYALLFLFRICSNLEKLKIQITNCTLDEPDYLFLDEEDFSSILLHHLQEVTLESFEGTFPEMTLMKLLLEKSPKLKRMVISRFIESNGKLVASLKKLNKFRRASQDVEVIFED